MVIWLSGYLFGANLTKLTKTVKKQIVPEDKCQYLIQFIVPGTRASEVVQRVLPTGPNHSKAIKSLKYRFGKDDLLVE